jgi:DNA-binding XRE family transcriptional regulator
VRPYCRIASHTEAEVRNVLLALERIYHPSFPELNLRQWTGSIYTWLTHPLLSLREVCYISSILSRYISRYYHGAFLDKYLDIHYTKIIKRKGAVMPTLREIREKNYLSRRMLADLAGVSESTIVRIEEGKSRTRENVAEKVIKALSNKIGQQITINDVEGLNLYNIMRDRKQRTKATGDSTQAA